VAVAQKLWHLNCSPVGSSRGGGVRSRGYAIGLFNFDLSAFTVFGLSAPTSGIVSSQTPVLRSSTTCSPDESFSARPDLYLVSR
jgi:hypothetical protein